jgi:aspartyl protease family protein
MRAIYVVIVSLSITSLSSCSSCSRAGRKKAKQESNGNSRHEKTTIKMVKVNGVYQVPIEVNGTSMSFIFDTGASAVSISLLEAEFLFKQGKITEADVIGKQQFMDANGGISEGTLINLKEVKIGNRTVNNIKASVVHNNKAPLLLGQSVFERFGKISIDNNKGEITLE